MTTLEARVDNGGGTDVYTITLATPLSIVQENRAVPSIAFELGNDEFVTPDEVTSQDGRPFQFTLPSQLTAKDGKTYVAHEVTETTSETSEDTGNAENPEDKLKNLKDVPDTDWKTAKNGTKEKIYTQSVRVEKDSHYSSATVWSGIRVIWTHWTQDHYWKHYVQTKYSKESGITQETTQQVTISGQTTTITTTMLYDETTSLKAWIVDGKEYKPGDTVTVNGNSKAIPVFQQSRKLKQKTVETVENNGETIYNYKATAIATIITQEANGVIEQDCGIFCNGRKCDKYTAANGQAQANANASTVPAISGYRLVDNATAGTQRDLNGVNWEQQGKPVTHGTTTTNIKVYDGDGNLLSETNN